MYKENIVIAHTVNNYYDIKVILQIHRSYDRYNYEIKMHLFIIFYLHLLDNIHMNNSNKYFLKFWLIS